MAEAPDPPAPRPTPGPEQPPTVDLPPALTPLNPSTLVGEHADTAPGSAAASGDGGPSGAARSFGDYELLEEIGRGSMGVVYRARERHSGRLVALKMMLDLQGRAGGDLRRFALEARATGQLSHPGIVTIHTWGKHEGAPFYTMDYVPGVLLSRLLEDGPLPCDRAVRYLIGIARAVGAAHALGIVHRDLKPGNVIIDTNDQPRVLDFGLAKRLSSQSAAGSSPSTDSIPEVLPADLAAPAGWAARPPTTRATAIGAILGTPAYMAPEQAVGDHRKIGPATDVHALGAIFYEMLAGRAPFQAGSVLDTLKKVVERDPPPLRSWGLRVPAAVQAVCLRALRKDPRARYPDAGALADDLEQRWQRCLHAPRFARLAAGATLAFAVLAGARLAAGRLGWHPLSLMRALTAGTGLMTEHAAAVVALLLDAAWFGGALLAFLAALAWLGAYVWYADRAGRIVAAVGCAAAVSWAWWLLALPEGDALSLAGASLLTAAATVAAGCWILRGAVTRSDRAGAGPEAAKTEPFLQRLFAVSPRGRSGASARPQGPAEVGLADFELGKVLHGWPGGRVHRGRQKSLDRPVLVWLATAPAPAGMSLPGVLVRHPGVLGLYAIGSWAEGWFVVTEPAAAVPLAELLDRSALEPQQAVALAARLARIAEAFHQQGACHGRLVPEWVLVRGDLEPVLCPCGSPCRSEEDRGRDLRAMGELLLAWLPREPRRGQRRRLAAAYQMGHAAREGRYGQAADLAEDLDRAARSLQTCWRERLTVGGLLGLAVAPWLALWAARDAVQAGFLLVALAPGCALLGYTHGRVLTRRHRLRRRRIEVQDVCKGLLHVALFTVPAALLVGHGLPRLDLPGTGIPGALLAAGELLGCWLAGFCLAGLVTASELVLGTLKPAATAAEP
jgi:serine/threonine-protein kinase